MVKDASREEFEAWCATVNSKYRTTDDFLSNRRDFEVWKASREAMEADAQVAQSLAYMAAHKKGFEAGVKSVLDSSKAPIKPITGPCGQCKSIESPCYCASDAPGRLKALLESKQHEPGCPDCKAPGLLYECAHCGATSYPKGAPNARTHADMLKASALELKATERQVEILSDELSKCSKQAQAVEKPVAWIGDSPSKGNGKRLFWSESAAYAYADKYAPLYTHPAPSPAGEQIDWQDMYLKAKSEKEAMAAKYEKDIGTLARVVPVSEAQQVAVPAGCKYPTCHSEEYQQVVTAQITAELWTGVVVPPGYALVPLEPTLEMCEAGNAFQPDCCITMVANMRRQYRAMLKAAPQPPQGDKP